MAAAHAMVIEGNWFPYCPGNYNSNFESWTEAEKQVAERVLSCIKRDFGVSRYWFPSPRGAGGEHIKRVDGMWAQALCDTGLRYQKLRFYRDAYRAVSLARRPLDSRTQPRSIGNVAELSTSDATRTRIP